MIQSDHSHVLADWVFFVSLSSFLSYYPYVIWLLPWGFELFYLIYHSSLFSLELAHCYITFRMPKKLSNADRDVRQSNKNFNHNKSALDRNIVKFKA